MSEKNFLTFGAPAIEQPEIDAVVATLQSGWLGTGPRVAQFEREFAGYKNIKRDNVVALSSCTAALHLSMVCDGFEPGDEVITSAMTFCATVNSIIHAGLKPVLVDVESDSFNMDPESIEAAITDRTRAIVVVHFAGRPCNMNSIMAIAENYNLIVIEDCAHAIETEYQGGKAGLFGHYGCFSFYATKNLTTGEGGMLLARDSKAAERIKVLALHGMSKDAWHRFGDRGYKHYQVVDCGFKYNMMDLQAAIGIHQLARLELNWTRRERVWQTYQDELSELPIQLPSPPEVDTRHAYHLYTVLVDEKIAGVSRDGFLELMTSNNLGVGVHYLCIAEHPYYQQKFDWRPEAYPNAMKIGRQTVSLPLSAKLSENDMSRVVETVKNIFTQR